MKILQLNRAASNGLASIILETLLAALLMAMVGCHDTRPLEWHSNDIGGSSGAASTRFDGQQLTLIGAGTGASQKPGGDQMRLASVTQSGGDVEVRARLVSLEGAPDAQAGLMLRAGDAGPMAMLEFRLPREGEANASLQWLARDHAKAGEPPATGQSGIATRQSPPLWLRVVRIGKNFGVYKSADGQNWTPLGNVSGWQFAADGPFEVGLFIAGGEKKQPATAIFDHITIGRPQMGYRTSWVGNTFSANRDDRFVSNGIRAMWAAPDGTCYTNSYWDEGGEPIKVYRDGRVIKSFRDGNEAFGNSFCGEGSISGDADHIYVANRNHLYVTDRLGNAAATHPIDFDIDPYDKKKNINIFSGIASNGTEVFVSDARENCVRVAMIEKPACYTAGNTSVNHTEHAIDTAGVAHAAPATVYQTQRETDYTPYVLAGLTPGGVYTVRCHFAEYTADKPGKRVINIHASGATSVNGFDVIAAAGAPFKAVVVDLPNAKADASGKLSVAFEKGAGGNGHIVICGIEALAADGSRALAINCGGPDVDGFKGESHELSARRFAFERPGSIVVDRRGELWILQRANEFPLAAETMTAQYPAAIKCYRTDGTFTGRQITDLVNPFALAYDAARDRLLVAENGPDQNVRIYSSLADKPAYASSFGIKGGLYAGAHPGLLRDPDAGGDARFYGLTGVGVDSAGAIYVSSGLQGTDLRKFTPDGRMSWRLNSLFFCNTPDVDPDSDGSELYSTYTHLSMDLSKTAPGSEWKFTAYNWDAARFGTTARVGNSQALVRRLGPDRKLILFTSGQGVIESAKIFRYEGEIVIPCGEVRKQGSEVWIDHNGDGKEQPAEVAALPNAGGLTFFDVDQHGDLWLGLATSGIPAGILRHLRFLGLNEHGAPRYGTDKSEFEDIRFPDQGFNASSWGNGVKVHYDSQRDIMFLIGPARSRKSDKEDPVQYMARYDRWSTGNRTALWCVTLPNPDQDLNFMYEVGRPYNLALPLMGMDVAGDKIFIASLWGEVFVFDALTGKREAVLCVGPELSGSCAWEDATMGLRAFRRKNGEYLIFTENSGWAGKVNFFRWKP